MKTIALVQTKGGCGKSTAAINIAVAASKIFLDPILLVDTDQQGSSMQWAQLRACSGPHTISARPADLRAMLATARMKYGFCVIDTAGHDVRALQITIKSIDLAVIVSRPTLFDIHVAMHIRDILVANGCDYVLLLNQVPNQVGERLRSWSGMYERIGKIITPFWGYLFDFQDASAVGLGVVEYRGQGRAAQQVTQTFEHIVRCLEQRL